MHTPDRRELCLEYFLWAEKFFRKKNKKISKNIKPFSSFTCQYSERNKKTIKNSKRRDAK